MDQEQSTSYWANLTSGVKKRALRQMILGSPDLLILQFIQQRPITAVEIRFTASTGATYDAIGWSKVCWPDEWDAEKGGEVAMARASADIARQLIADGLY